VSRRRRYYNKDEKILRKLREMRGEDPDTATTSGEWKRQRLNRNRTGIAEISSEERDKINYSDPIEIEKMRGRFSRSGGRYSVYVMRLKPSAYEITMKFPTDERNISRNRSRGLKIYEIWNGIIPTGCVYVGYTSKIVSERFDQHREGGHLAAKIAKKNRCKCHPDGHLSSQRFWDCCGELTDLFGIEGIVNERDAKKLESWVGWSLYLHGYCVWGPDFHEKEKFLGEHPFEAPPHDPVLKSHGLNWGDF